LSRKKEKSRDLKVFKMKGARTVLGEVRSGEGSGEEGGEKLPKPGRGMARRGGGS